MRNKIKQLVISLILFISTIANAQTVSIDPTNDNIQYFGRWDFTTPAAPFCSWPSLYIKVKFVGTGITAKFTNPGVDFIYTIDGGSPVRINAPVDDITISGLPAEEHLLMVSRTTEYNGGYLTFNGLEIQEGNILSPDEKPCLKFEFVGNSILSGLATDHDTWDNGKGPWISGTWNQNAYMSWGPQLARLYDAEYRVESHSGMGMHKNLNNSSPEAQASDEFTFKHYYPGWARTGWNQLHDFQKDDFAPNYFFCALGTNDWADQNYNSGIITSENYIARYNQFIDFVYAKYPKTKFIVMTTLLSVRGWQVGNEALKQMVATRKANGDDIYFIDTRGWLPNQKDYGNDWTHPTTEGHRKIAERIKDFMDTTPSIKNDIDAIALTCGVDCNGDLGGIAKYDGCGVCYGGNAPIQQPTCDCNGDKEGSASFDNCGVCSGGQTGIDINACEDCNGEANGLAYYDNCNVCVGGNSTNIDCEQDCGAINFNNSDDFATSSSSSSMSISESNGYLNISASSTGQYDFFQVGLNEPIDFTNVVSQKIWLRAKATNNVIITPAPRDGEGNIASNNALSGGNWTNEGSNVLQVTPEWKIFVIDFSSKLNDAWGCGCDLDATNIPTIYFGINPGWDSQWKISNEAGGLVDAPFTGTIEIDYIKIAEEDCEGLLTPAVDKATDAEFSVYPNPAKNQVRLNTKRKGEKFTLQIFDESGRMIKEAYNLTNGSTFQVNDLASGIYILTLSSKSEITHSKIIIE